MGTRSGSVDPGILTYLMRQGQLQPAAIDDVLNKESGLLGVSGVSGDMREILAAMKEGHARAKLAFDIYVHRLRDAAGSSSSSPTSPSAWSCVLSHCRAASMSAFTSLSGRS